MTIKKIALENCTIMTHPEKTFGWGRYWRRIFAEIFRMTRQWVLDLIIIHSNEQTGLSDIIWSSHIFELAPVKIVTKTSLSVWVIRCVYAQISLVVIPWSAWFWLILEQIYFQFLKVWLKKFLSRILEKVPKIETQWQTFSNHICFL